MNGDKEGSAVNNGEEQKMQKCINHLELQCFNCIDGWYWYYADIR